MKKKTQNQFIKEANLKHNNFYDYSKSIYKNANEKITIICPKHGKFQQRAIDHLKGFGCKFCAYENNGNIFRFTQKEFIQKANKIHNNQYDYSQVNYQGADKKVQIICKKHGLFLQGAREHLNGCECPKCARKLAREKLVDTIDEYITKARKIHLDKFVYHNFKMINGNKYIEVECPIHGLFIQETTNHLAGHSCPKCSYEEAGKQRRLSTEQYVEKAQQAHENLYTYNKTDYITAFDPVIVTCPKHGDFSIVACWHTNNQIGCPRCSTNGTSKLEKLVQSWLEEWRINFEIRKKICSKDKKVEVDIFIPQQKTAIEINGLYWHSELAGRDKNYHLRKTEICESNGIQLIHIFENEFETPEKIKDRLKYILHVDCLKKIYARQCVVQMIGNKMKNEFLEQYHSQGKDNSSYWLGLYLHNELVAVMTFSKKRACFGYVNKTNDQFELVRFCIKSGYSIIGGASKLLTFFERSINPKQITTFADRRWSTGNLYYQLGFHLKHCSKPSYWYFKTKKEIFHRFNFRKNILKDKLKVFNNQLTEWENLKANGFNRIWDCGQFVFEKTLPIPTLSPFPPTS